MRRLVPRTLRSRLFAGIAAAVAVSIVVTLVAGALLTRRSLEQEALRSLGRQVDLIAAQRSAKAAAPEVGSFLATEQERLTILTPAQAELLLPAKGNSYCGILIFAAASMGRAVSSSICRATRSGWMYGSRGSLFWWIL